MFLDSLAPYTTSVDFPEFLTLMAQEVGVDDEEDMKSAIGGIFDFFDTDKKGYISSSQLRYVLDKDLFVKRTKLMLEIVHGPCIVTRL